MKMNIIQVVTWSIVGLGVLIAFLLPNTIENWGDNKLKTILLASLFIIGFATDFILRILEKSKKYEVKRDERDSMIQSKSMGIGFIVIILYIYLLSIGLYTKYEASGFMPVGWVWFIAYTTIVMANISAGISSLILYKKQGY